MIGKFFDWSFEQGPGGMIVWLIVMTFLCATGLAIPILIYDVLKGVDK